MTEKGKKGTGPPPHIHYAEDEWFFPVGEGQVRLRGLVGGWVGR